ncbi:MAG: nucleotide exchange factor GrpE [Alphaproteobacteria bacterium]|nr:nucleotide exchange factor GrpE [Alphaproteobacteria bacterium]
MNKKNKEKALNETLKEAVEETTPETVEETVNEPLEDDVSSQAEEEIQKWRDIALRSQAEMENLRKRTQIDIEKAHKYAHASFAKDLLPVADYLAGAIDYAQKEIEKSKEAGTECDVFLVNLLKGVEMTQKQLHTVFEHHQIKKMETKDIVFDPNLHKVIQEVEDDTKEAGTIVQELQAGYTIGGDRVLREAMVIVSK